MGTVLTVLLVFLALPLLNVNRYRAGVASAIGNAVGRTVSVGEVSLRAFPQPGFTLSDVVSDNASAGAFYLGPVARRLDQLEDLRLLGCVVRVDGDVAMTAAGAAVMGHPAASVAWLADQLAKEGEVLGAGQLIFSGGVTAPVPVVAGRSVTFEFDGLGSIEVYGA